MAFPKGQGKDSFVNTDLKSAIKRANKNFFPPAQVFIRKLKSAKILQCNCLPRKGTIYSWVPTHFKAVIFKGLNGLSKSVLANLKKEVRSRMKKEILLG